MGTDPSGQTQRNLFGQIDGTANPLPADADYDQLLYSDGADRRWMRGGTSLVLRRIRMTMDTWEEIERSSRELTIGRKLDSGAPLTGTAEHNRVDRHSHRVTHRPGSATDPGRDDPAATVQL
ncbi:Dyp-type peroxidase [Dietzia sp. PP-33]|nr:Dyp-type peroxidase domain-containing protein [Dietzia sp. PP-33]MDX2356042.1 Dyp-type peroxidase [Dietzia sp. PP-33]